PASSGTSVPRLGVGGSGALHTGPHAAWLAVWPPGQQPGCARQTHKRELRVGGALTPPPEDLVSPWAPAKGGGPQWAGTEQRPWGCICGALAAVKARVSQRAARAAAEAGLEEQRLRVAGQGTGPRPSLLPAGPRRGGSSAAGRKERRGMTQRPGACSAQPPQLPQHSHSGTWARAGAGGPGPGRGRDGGCGKQASVRPGLRALKRRRRPGAEQRAQGRRAPCGRAGGSSSAGAHRSLQQHWPRAAGRPPRPLLCSPSLAAGPGGRRGLQAPTAPPRWDPAQGCASLSPWRCSSVSPTPNASPGAAARAAPHSAGREKRGRPGAGDSPLLRGDQPLCPGRLRGRMGRRALARPGQAEGWGGGEGGADFLGSPEVTAQAATAPAASGAATAAHGSGELRMEWVREQVEREG
ncbi:hypothetical protein J0S82_004281, partial [Galemys pyrenaicus]